MPFGRRTQSPNFNDCRPVKANIGRPTRALKAKLDAAGVYNEFNFYPDGGHADWDATTFAEVYNKVEAFLQARF